MHQVTSPKEPQYKHTLRLYYPNSVYVSSVQCSNVGNPLLCLLSSGQTVCILCMTIQQNNNSISTCSSRSTCAPNHYAAITHKTHTNSAQPSNTVDSVPNIAAYELPKHIQQHYPRRYGSPHYIVSPLVILIAGRNVSQT